MTCSQSYKSHPYITSDFICHSRLLIITNRVVVILTFANMDLMLNYLDLPNVNEESDSDTELPIRYRAVFETTKRLLVQLINKILMRVTDIKTYGHKGFEDLVYLKPKYSSDEEDMFQIDIEQQEH